MNIKSKLRVVAGLTAGALALSLSGCAQNPASQDIAPFHQLSAPQYHSLAAKLRARGVLVTKQQGSVSMVIQSNALFYIHRMKIRKDQTKTLDIMATLVRHAPTSTIRVIGYSDYIPTVKGQYALSHKMAAIVANELWRRGVPSWQKMKIEAKANTRPVSGSLTAKGNAQNQRVAVLIN